MPEPKRPLKVFLCHAHADRDAVRALYTRLTKDGVDAWLDKEKLVGGQDWEYEIRKAVRESDIVVVCHSKQFNQKGFRQKEVRIALEEADLLPKGEIFIIPVRLEECDVLDDLSRWHWVDLFEHDGYEMLMRALRARADKIGATLQIHRGWLPKVNTKPAVVKRPSLPIEKPVEIKQEKSKSKKAIQTPKISNKIIIGVVGFIVLVLAAVFGLPPLIRELEPTPTVTNTQPSKTFTPIVASNTPTITSMPIQIYTITPTPFPAEITDAKNAQMVLVPEGEFLMGPDPVISCKNSTWADCEEYYKEHYPVRQVFLDTFYIDKYEVTNALYQMCVQAGACKRPRYDYIFSDTKYYGNPLYDNYPVVWMSWDMANSYCVWRDARLPTEAEWEKAARGTDNRTYPWGNDFDGSRVNFCDRNCPMKYYLRNDAYDDGYKGTAPVGFYSAGASPYGAYDMVGNVSEWAADWYQYDYYATLGKNIVNPQGPSSGETRVLRGGSWIYNWGLDSVSRGGVKPTESYISIGFRCARDVSP